MPVTRKHGQLSLEWDTNEVLYAANELSKKHLHFFHPGTDNLFNLISKTNPENSDKETEEMIKMITEACTICQRNFSKSQSFQLPIAGDIVFNQKNSLDLMVIDKLPCSKLN